MALRVETCARKVTQNSALPIRSGDRAGQPMPESPRSRACAGAAV